MAVARVRVLLRCEETSQPCNYEAQLEMRIIVLVSIGQFLVLLCVLVTGACGGAASPPASSSAAIPSEESNTEEIASKESTAKPSNNGNEGPRTLEELCETVTCRKDVTVSLQQADGSPFSKTYPLIPPAVQSRLISVLAGETVLIEATATTERPTEFVQVASITHPERTLSFNLTQHIEDGKAFMMLTSKNPFSRDIRFHVGMMILSHDSIVKTSSCPVAAGQEAFEIWPEPLFQIVIEDIHFLKDDDNRGCVE